MIFRYRLQVGACVEEVVGDPRAPATKRALLEAVERLKKAEPNKVIELRAEPTGSDELSRLIKNAMTAI